MRRIMRPIAAITFGIALAISHPGAAWGQETPIQSTGTGAQTEDEATAEAAAAAKSPAEGRENLEPSKEGFDDNNIDNDAGVDWEPTDDPEPEVISGEMRSDSEEIPGGFTKEEADQAEVQEAEEQSQQNRVGVMATPTNCRTYWPSPFKVCGEIRKKYDAMGGPASFLTWPRSDEKGVPDGVGRRNEFVNGFIYWHPTHGAHPITTHFSFAYDRNGWEAGGLGYPTSDEFATPNGIGRKQEFENGAIYGSPAGLAAVEGRIYDKYVSMGASDSILSFPLEDETGTPDGVGRFSKFVAGFMYWHPDHGAHQVAGDILFQWSYAGNERSIWGYPSGDPVMQDDGWYKQKFAEGHAYGKLANGLADVYDPNSYEEPSHIAPQSNGSAGGNAYTDKILGETEDYLGNRVVLRRGYWPGVNNASKGRGFGYDKIAHKHKIWGKRAIFKFVEETMTYITENQGGDPKGRRIYEEDIRHLLCIEALPCMDSGQWFRVRLVYDPNVKAGADPGEEFGVVTFYPITGVGSPAVSGVEAPSWFSTQEWYVDQVIEVL